MTLRFASILVGALCAACDLTPDDHFVGAPGPPPFFVASTTLPSGSRNVALNQPITIGFSRYLDPDSFEYFNALILQSGGISAPGIARYQLADRTMTFFPTRDLRPDLIYTLFVNPETIRAVGGEALAIPFALSFQTSLGGTVLQERDVPGRSFETDVAPILGASCSCHQSDGALPPLEYDALVGVASTQLPERLLVLPYDAPRSYLMHKVLPSYPDRRFAEMPPPWSDLPSLDTEQLRVLEEWIVTGAAP